MSASSFHEPGRELSEKYQLVQVLGEGASGRVYRAVQKSLKRPVAIKFLKGLHTADPVQVERFRREAQVLAGLDHPSILRVYDYGLDGEVPYLVTELLGEDSLRKRMRPGIAVEHVESFLLTMRILDALGHVHERGTLHRDIKPENILLRGDRDIVLADFGLAKMQGHDTGWTRIGCVVGTPRYMAPEVLDVGEYSEQSDLYSVGTILFELLTGLVPFEGHLEQVVARKIAATPPAAATLNPLLDPAAGEIVDRALRRNPAERYRSAREFQEWIVRVFPFDSTTIETAALSILDHVPGPMAGAGHPGHRGRSSKPHPVHVPQPAPSRVWIGFASIAAFLVGVFLVLVSRTGTARVGAPAARPAAGGSPGSPDPPATRRPVRDLARSLDQALVRFDPVTRTKRMATIWRDSLVRRESGSMEQRFDVKVQVENLEQAARRDGVLEPMEELLARGSEDPVVAGPVHPSMESLYMKMNDLMSLERLVRFIVADTPDSPALPPIFRHPLPPAWQETSSSGLEHPHVYTLVGIPSVGDMVRDPPSGEFAWHRIVPAWSPARFYTHRITDYRDAIATLGRNENPGHGKPHVRYRHPDPIPFGPGGTLEALEVGLCYGGHPDPHDMFTVSLQVDRGPWRTCAILGRHEVPNHVVGQTSFLRIDPAFAAGEQVFVEVAWNFIPGTKMEGRSTLSWLSILWKGKQPADPGIR